MYHKEEEIKYKWHSNSKDYHRKRPCESLHLDGLSSPLPTQSYVAVIETCFSIMPSVKEWNFSNSMHD